MAKQIGDQGSGTTDRKTQRLNGTRTLELTREERALVEKYAFVPEDEPAATQRALQDSKEGEHLYREIKEMEQEAIEHPDPEDERVDVIAANGIAEDGNGGARVVLPINEPEVRATAPEDMLT